MSHSRIVTVALLGSASLLTLSTAARAQSVLFSTNPDLKTGVPLDTGREMSVAKGIVQVRLPGGATASFVDAAQFSLRGDGSVDLRSGSVTVVGATGATVAVHLPKGVRGTVAGNSAATFTASPDGAHGSTTAGAVSVLSNGVTKSFTVGQFWTARGDRSPDRMIAGSAAAVPAVTRTNETVRPMLAGGVAAAAENGLPVALGEALAGVGARGDIVAAARRIEAYDANPTIAAFPTGDYAVLVGYAAQADGLLGAGGTTFTGAGADIIRTYFEYLASGNAGAGFRSAYSQVLLNYLDLLRSGVLPSTFRGATQVQLTAYLAFIGRTDGFGGLSAGNRQLLDAYTAFLGTGGTPDAFGLSVTNLTTAFLNYVRAGGNPATFTQASATVVAQYLAIVSSGGLRTNLTTQNQALLTAYLANNGIGFTTTYATGLAAFVAYLNAGGLPSGYTALPQATVRQYLETLETTNLFDSVLGTQSAFLRSYLVFLRGGGTADQFNALPINLARVNAANLNLYVEYLLAGGAPTAYTVLTQAQIRSALDQLTATGQFTTLLGINAAFLGEYYTYIRTGADADTFAGLPSVDVNAYATSLQLFAAYLRAGNLPSGYTTLSAQQIRSYLTALQTGGKLGLLGDNATLLGEYLAYVRTGGAPDAFAGLPIVTYQSYATALTAYYAYLNAGGLPSGYTALTQAQLRTYLDLLRANGQFALLGANGAFYTNYLAYLAGGGAADAFNGLPAVTYQSYATALTAYFAYLNAGGLPSNYAVLTQAQIRTYLDALSTNAQLTALLGGNAAFFTQYRAYLLTGASVDAYNGLPIVIYQSYAAALNAYYAFLLGGGTPTAYTALSQAQIRSYLDALKAAGQVSPLLGANSAFFTQYLAFLETGGTANSYPGLPSSTYGQYASALSLYFAYLNGGGLPSGYAALSQAQIREYLSALQANNQLTALLGANATFFANYLTFVSGGGAADAFTGLPIVTYRGYATALTAYYAFLAGGGLPASYTALSQAQIRAYLDALSAANQITALLGQNAAFFTSYYAYLASGGAPNGFTGLPSVTYAQYGSALQTFVAFLRGNGLPGSYTALTSAQIREYLAVLQSNGQLGLIGSSADQQLLSAYASYLASGGLPNQFTGLPAFASYESALRSYYAFLQAGGRPSAYTALTQAQIVAYFAALDAAGLATTRFSSAEASLLRTYVAFVSGGGNGDQFAGLPGNQPIATPVVTQGLANAPRSTDTGRAAIAAAGHVVLGGGAVDGTIAIDGNSVKSAGSSRSLGLTVGTAKTLEGRTVDNTIAIARIADGTYQSGGSTYTATVNQGVHLVWGTPATALPTAGGVVTYGLVAATSPTADPNVQVAAGTFTGNFALDIARRTVGYDSIVAIGTSKFVLKSNGGIVTPSVSLREDLTFQVSNQTVSGAQGASVLGFLSGVGGVYAGLSYQLFSTTYNQVSGAAIFGRGAALVTLPDVVTANLTSPIYAYAAGLPTQNLYVRSVNPTGTTTVATGLDFRVGTTVSSDSNGGLRQAGTGSEARDIVRGTAKVVDIAGDSRAVIGRWTDGTYTRGGVSGTLTASQGLHYVELAPAGFSYPTSGQINYTLLAATQPTYSSGITGAGLFDGKMALAFGSAVKVALEGTIRMPEPSGTVTYAFATSGGVAGVNALTGQTFSNNVVAVSAPITGSGLACTSACLLNFTGGFGGTTDLNRIGAVYFTSDARGDAGPQIQGAAIFTGTAATTSGGGTSAFTGTVGNQTTYAYSGGSMVDAGAGAVTYENGNIKTYQSVLTGRTITAGVVQESGRLSDTIGWARWTGDTAGPSTNQGPNAGVHVMSGTPTVMTTLPTTGTAQYTLAGSTRPTLAAPGTVTGAPGTIAGSLAVAYGSIPRVGFDLTMTAGEYGWRVATTGGTANPGQSLATVSGQGAFSATFNKNGGTVTPTTSASCLSGCGVTVGGQFYGAGGSHIGVAFNATDSGPAGTALASGIAIFAKAP